MIEDPVLIDLISSLAEGVGDDPIAEAETTLDRLDQLSGPALASLCCSKDGIAKIKERLLVEDSSLRVLFINRLGKIIVRVWMVVNSEGFDIEGYARVASRTEARRMVDDFADMAIDTMKSFALGALGHAPASDASQTLPDNLACTSAYAAVLAHLLDQYSAAYEPLDEWVDALTGLSGSSSLAVHTAADVANRNASISLLPLLKPAMMAAFKDRFQLIQRCQQLPSYGNGVLRLVSAFMRTLLTDLSPTASLLTVLVSPQTDSGSGQSLFSAGAGADVSDSTAAGALPLPLISYVTEWVETVLLSILSSDITSGGGLNAIDSGVGPGVMAVELSAVIKDVLRLTQHTALAALRHKVAPTILQKLFHLLEYYDALFPAAEVPRTELVAWALLSIRYIRHLDDPRPLPAESAEANASAGSGATSADTSASMESVAYAYYTRLFKILCDIEDSVAQTRLFTEFSVLIVHHAIDADFKAVEVPASEEWAKHGVSRTGYRFTPTLPAALVRSAFVRQLLDAGARTAPAAVLARFVAALCATFTAAVLFTLTPVLLLLPGVTKACGSGQSTGGSTAAFTATASAEIDVFSFTPTIVAPEPTATTTTKVTQGASNDSDKPSRSAQLDAYLTGREENLHPWALLHDGIGGARVRRLCTSLHARVGRQTSGTAPTLSAATVERVQAEYRQLVAILVGLVEGAVFVAKTFESCLKWPLGETVTTGAVPTAEALQVGYQRSDAAQHALVSLLALVGRVISPSPAAGGLFATPTATGDMVEYTTSTAVLSALAPYTQSHRATISAVRTELWALLAHHLEWITADFSRVQNAHFVQELLVCVIDSHSAQNEMDALASAELILTHARHLLYQAHVYQEYLLTLQARASQGFCGGAVATRFDGLAHALSSQLLGLELVHLLAQQHATGSGNKVLQSCVQLIRTVERDYVWSAALELKTALSCTSAALDEQLRGTWITPGGVEISKLPVSPLLKDGIAQTLRSVLALLPQPIPPAVRSACVALYSNSAIHAYLRDTPVDADCHSGILALNDLTFGPASDLPTGAKSPLFTPATSATTVGSAGWATQLTGSAAAPDGSVGITSGALALLERLNGACSAVEGLADGTSVHQAFGLFSRTTLASTASSGAAGFIPRSAYVCHSDVLAQAQDVVAFHLHALAAPLLKSRAEQSLDIIARSAQVRGGASSSTDLTEQALELLTPSELAGLEATALLPPRERFWTTVSGSADLLTVHASTEVDLLTQTASVHVRVYNSSGFKIPTFALHLLVHGGGLSLNRAASLTAATTDTPGVALAANGAALAQQSLHASLQRVSYPVAPQSSAAATTTAAAFPTLSAWLDKGCVLVQAGTDFFLPDAYVERTFTFRVPTFAPVEATVRIVYADLVYDEDNIYEIPIEAEVGGTGKGKRNSNSKKPKQQGGAGHFKTAPYLGEYRPSHSTKWAAVLDCAPLNMPITALLLPYGYGSFSGLRHFAQAHRVKGENFTHSDLYEPGIPESVFRSQWSRLGGMFEVSLPVEGELLGFPSVSAWTVAGHHLSALVSAQVLHTVKEAIATYGGRGMHLLGVDGMVAFAALPKDQYSLLPYLERSAQANESAGAEGSGFAYTPTTAWCLQTPWAGEVCVKLTVHQLPSPVPAVPSSNTVTAFDALDAVAGGESAFLPSPTTTTGAGAGISTNASASWTGRLSVRCSDARLANAVLADADYFVYALTGGYAAPATDHFAV